jgi:hypothetical protein
MPCMIRRSRLVDVAVDVHEDAACQGDEPGLLPGHVISYVKHHLLTCKLTCQVVPCTCDGLVGLGSVDTHDRVDRYYDKLK